MTEIPSDQYEIEKRLAVWVGTLAAWTATGWLFDPRLGLMMLLGLPYLIGLAGLIAVIPIAGLVIAFVYSLRTRNRRAAYLTALFGGTGYIGCGAMIYQILQRI
ncbi:hypothetical protein [Alienimonas chondri]|uniref:Uncharacterized protein n=1 Tax=Alienimonas chondri TaxID=2681879 RepID=A0ABX1VGK6_9PLAN|nr:hypothetical protein [Alienimonas chondri]NNJ26973.1 hypothetical protein [Alienimonas chondri]